MGAVMMNDMTAVDFTTDGIGFHVFGKACVSARIVKTISKLVKLHPPSTSYPKGVYMTQYRHSLVSIIFSCRVLWSNESLSHDVTGILMEVTTSLLAHGCVGE